MYNITKDYFGGYMNNSCVTDIKYSNNIDATHRVPHRHSLYQLIYIKQGTVIFSAANTQYKATAPCLLFISNLESHSIDRISHEYERYVVSIDPVSAESKMKNEYLMSVFSTHKENFCHVLDVTPINDRINLLLTMMYEERTKYKNDTTDDDWKLLSILLTQVSYFSPNIFHMPLKGIEKTIEEIKSELETNISIEFSLDEIADKYFISRYYLAHSFKKYTGYSIKQYRLLCQLALARNLLVNTDLNITDIASRSGFNDMSNFSRYFREKNNCSPSEYRERFSHFDE